MKTKLRRLVSILSAMVLMVCCAVPAFADDTVVSLTDDNISGFIISSTSQSLKKNFGSTDYAYVTSWRYRNGAYDYMLLVFDSKYKGSSIPDDELSFGAATVFSINDNSYIVNSSFNSVKPLNSQTNIRDTEGIYYKWFNDSATHIVYSNVSLEGLFDFADPNAPPTPFTVDYSPALSEGMSRKGTLVAPGASNDGQEIESNGLNVRVTLTDEFIKLRDSYDELKDYTYEFVCYITTSPPEKSSYEESVKNAVYTSLDYGKYMYTTSGVVDDVTDDNKEPTEWIKAEGINAGYIIGKGGSVKNVTINLENLDSSQFTADTKLYIVVYGRLTSLSVPTPDYFDLDNQGYLCNQGSLNTKQIVTVNADPETGEGTDVVMPDYYCVTSTAFNYKDYPEYKPKIFKNGAEMDTNKPFTDYLDKKLTPDYMYDYDMDKNGESGLAPDDFEKYEEQKNLDKNFGSVDFGLDSIKSVFDGSSDFFKFLTASIGILPTTFLTILISFFVVMLAICVVKWVLK